MKISLQAENRHKNQYNSNPDTGQHRKNVSFGFDGIVAPTVDAIARGGLGVSFVIQDFLGMVLPRAIAGLSRNKDITGENNYQEAMEVTIREAVSGPSLFVIPAVILFGIKRCFGKANDIPIRGIKALGDLFAALSKSKSLEILSSEKKAKEEFYKSVFENALKNAHGQEAKGVDVSGKAAAFAKQVLNIEAAPRKTLWKRIRNLAAPNTSDDMTAKLANEFFEIRKSGSKNPSADFSKMTLTLSDGSNVEFNFEKMLSHLRDFTEDVSKALNKKFTPKSPLGNISKLVPDFVKNFSNSRAGSRILTIITLIAGILVFGKQIPKLYQLSEENPGLKGLTAENMLNKDDKSCK